MQGRVGRRRQPPRLPQGHGCLPRARRPRRMHQAAGRAHLPVHQAAGRPRPRPPHVLRHRAPLPHRRHPRPGQVGRLPPHQDRRQSRPPHVQGQIGRHHPGHAARPLRSRSFATTSFSAARPAISAPSSKPRTHCRRHANRCRAARASTSCPKPSPPPPSPRSGPPSRRPTLPRGSSSGNPSTRIPPAPPPKPSSAATPTRSTSSKKPTSSSRSTLTSSAASPTPASCPMAAAYAERHRFDAEEPNKPMNRLYVVESMPTVTGFKAEHRLALKPSEIATFATALASGSSATFSNPDAAAFLAAVQKDLKASGGKCVVIAGEQAAPAVHAAAYRLNASLGAAGKTVTLHRHRQPDAHRAARRLHKPRRRHECRQGPVAGHARLQPGLHRAGRPRVRRRLRPRPRHRPPRHPPRRNRPHLHLAHQQGPLSRILVRRPHLRRP